MYKDLLISAKDFSFEPFLLHTYRNVSNLFIVSRKTNYETWNNKDANGIWKLNFTLQAYNLFGEIKSFDAYDKGKNFDLLQAAVKFAVKQIKKQSNIPDDFKPEIKQSRKMFVAYPTHLKDKLSNFEEWKAVMIEIKPDDNSDWVLPDYLFFETNHYDKLFMDKPYILFSTRKKLIEFLHSFVSKHLDELYDKQLYIDWKTAIEQNNVKKIMSIYQEYSDEMWWLFFIKPEVDLTQIFSY